MSKMPLVSLCIPTNGVIEWVFPVLDSIYKQGVDNSLYEVVITDNGFNSEFKNKIKEYINNHPNIVYAETNALPFINEIESYKRANGKLIKFVNHRTLLMKGALQRIIDYAREQGDEKPITYFANGVLEIGESVHEYKSFDSFVKNLSYWSSWSTGMAIWKEDFEKLPKDITDYNELFPHTNILFNERQRDRYIIDNTPIMSELPTGAIPKARYDLFYAFAVEYPAIILRLLTDDSISTETFLSIKRDSLNCIAQLYTDFFIKKKTCSYDLSSFDKSILVFYEKKSFKKALRALLVFKLKNKILSCLHIKHSLQR